MHVQDKDGNWQDKQDLEFPAKVASEDILDDYAYPNVVYDDGNYSWASSNPNYIGYVSGDGIHRAMWRWDLEDFCGHIPSYMDADVTDLDYTFHSTQDDDQCLGIYPVYSDPDKLSAMSVYNHLPFQLGTTITTETLDEGDHVYEIDLPSAEESRLETRANSDYEGDHWYGIGYKIYTDESSEGADICNSDGAGKVYITWSAVYEPEEKIAPLPLVVSPNPFNPQTTLKFNMETGGNAKLELFSTNGQKINTLTDGYLSKGYHSFIINGRGLSSGIYIYRLIVPTKEISGKILLMK